MKSNKTLHIVLDMDSTLLSMECLDTVIETALSAQLHPNAIAEAMKEVDYEMDKGMAGAAPLSETIPARIAIAKRVGAPVSQSHFDLVAQMVPSTLTPGILHALHATLVEYSGEIEISIVSGGPQICVDAAATALENVLQQVVPDMPLHIAGVGSDIVVDESGTFDTLRSRINNSKGSVVRAFVDDPSHAIMAGDGATDIAVFDAGVVGYFIAIGVWVERPNLFTRPENRPYFIKVLEDTDIAKAFHIATDAIRAS